MVRLCNILTFFKASGSRRPLNPDPKHWTKYSTSEIFAAGYCSVYCCPSPRIPSPLYPISPSSPSPRFYCFSREKRDKGVEGEMG